MTPGASFTVTLVVCASSRLGATMGAAVTLDSTTGICLRGGCSEGRLALKPQRM